MDTPEIIGTSHTRRSDVPPKTCEGVRGQAILLDWWKVNVRMKSGRLFKRWALGSEEDALHVENGLIKYAMMAELRGLDDDGNRPASTVPSAARTKFQQLVKQALESDDGERSPR